MEWSDECRADANSAECCGEKLPPANLLDEWYHCCSLCLPRLDAVAGPTKTLPKVAHPCVGLSVGVTSLLADGWATLGRSSVARTAWEWAYASQSIRWFTDGEKRYAQKLWRKARIYLKSGEADRAYRHRKVWRVLVRGCSEGEAVTGPQTRDVG